MLQNNIKEEARLFDHLNTLCLSPPSVLCVLVPVPCLPAHCPQPTGHQLACCLSLGILSPAEFLQVSYLFVEANVDLKLIKLKLFLFYLFYIPSFLFFLITSYQWNDGKLHPLHGCGALAPLCFWPPSVYLCYFKKKEKEEEESF